MRPLASIDAIAFSELCELCRAEERSPPYPPNGGFVRRERDGRAYWYFRGYERPIDGSPGHQTLRYVGVVGDPGVDRLAEDHDRRRAAYRTRRDLASRLRRAGLPSPQPLEGAIAGVLAGIGLFDSGSTLVGSVAFQTYSGLLGVTLREAGYRTEDMDVARAAGLRIHAGGGAVDLLGALKGVDPTFAAMFHASSPTLVAGYRNSSGFKVEFLTPVRSERTGSGGLLVEASGVPGVGAQALKFLEFVLKDSVASVILHDAGVGVSVPDPMRFAVHKLMVSCLRNSDGPSGTKARKDVQQAETLIGASVHARSTAAMGRVWLEAWHRGPKWRKLLKEGTLKLGPGPLGVLADDVIEAAAIDGLDSPFVSASGARATLLGREQENPKPASSRPMRTRRSKEGPSIA